MSEETQDKFMENEPVYLSEEQIAKAKEIAGMEHPEAAFALVSEPALISEYCLAVADKFKKEDALAAILLISSTMEEMAKLAKKDK